MVFSNLYRRILKTRRNGVVPLIKYFRIIFSNLLDACTIFRGHYARGLNIVVKKPSEEFQNRNHVLNTPVHKMIVMADLSPEGQYVNFWNWNLKVRGWKLWIEVEHQHLIMYFIIMNESYLNRDTPQITNKLRLVVGQYYLTPVSVRWKRADYEVWCRKLIQSCS